MRSSVDVDFSGPFFKADIDKTLLENVRKMMEGIAEEGEPAAEEGLLTGATRRALVSGTGDRVADHVVGRTESLTGKEWMTAAVVSVNRAGLDQRQAISLMAAASSVERRTRAISRVTRQLRAARAVLRANLTEGLE
jgi:hypothetical protein